MLQHFLALIRKEFLVEWRSMTSLQSLILYSLSIGFIIYSSFSFQPFLISAPVWTAFFWISLLFSATGASVRSFISSKGRSDDYLYQLTSATLVLFAKITYNFILLLLLFIVIFILFSILFGNPVNDVFLFVLIGLEVCLGLAASLTLLASVVARINNSQMLVSILGFPVVISVMILAATATRDCVDDLGWTAVTHELILLSAINCITLSVSYLLFPYIWRS